MFSLALGVAEWYGSDGNNRSIRLSKFLYKIWRNIRSLETSKKRQNSRSRLANSLAILNYPSHKLNRLSFILPSLYRTMNDCKSRRWFQIWAYLGHLLGPDTLRREQGSRHWFNGFPYSRGQEMRGEIWCRRKVLAWEMGWGSIESRGV